MKMWEGRAGRKQSVMEQVVRREWEARLKNEATKKHSEFQQVIYDHTHRFEVDTFFDGQRTSLLRDVFRERGVPLNLLRRVVEGSFNAALTANQRRVYESAIPDWEEGDRLAENARQALDAFLSWMSAPNPTAWRGGKREKNAASLMHHLVHATYLNDGAPNDRSARATNIANALLDAREFLSKVPVEYQRHRNSLVSEHLGEIEKMAFVEHLAEGWFYLCGKIHGPADRKFGEFVLAAWQDIGGQELDREAEESFSHTTRVSSQRLKARSLPNGWRPYWL